MKNARFSFAKLKSFNIFIIVTLLIALGVFLVMIQRGFVFRRSAAASSVPANIQNALRKGGAALVFGWYDGTKLHEFDNELPIIASAGAGHVRLSMSMNILENGTTGKVNDSIYQELLSFINKAWSNGLVTTIDNHNTGLTEPGSSDWTENYMWGIGNSAVEARHTSLMVDLATRLSRDVPTDRFIIQPANEPIGQSNWYTYQSQLYTKMRAACPQCTIMVMARDWQGIEATELELNVSSFTGPFIVDVHYYEPLGISHCAYPGQPNNCPGRQYPGTYERWSGGPTMYYDRSSIENQFMPLFNWAQQRGVFLNVGEFGTAAALDQTTRARYLGDLVSIFKSHGAGFTVWEWMQNFGVKQHPQVVSALFSGVPTTPNPSSAPVTPGPTNPPGSNNTPVPTSVSTPVPTSAPTGGCRTVCNYEDPDMCPAGSEWAGYQNTYANNVVTVCSSAAPVPTPTGGTGGGGSVPSGGKGFTGEYYSGKNFNNLVFSRIDQKIDFNWGLNQPDTRLTADNFSVRWTGSITPTLSGVYNFFVTADDGVRLRVNGDLIIDQWKNQSAVEHIGSKSLTAGQSVSIVMEYYEDTQNAIAKLSWSAPIEAGEQLLDGSLVFTTGATNPPAATPVPVTPAPTSGGGNQQPTPTPSTPATLHGLRGNYYNNIDFTSLVLSRIDPTVNFNWHVLSPDWSIGRDTFSVEWTGSVLAPHSGRYTFFTQSDDGVRLWLNDQLVIDNWRDQQFTERWYSVYLQQGKLYPIKIRYYENTGQAAMKLWWWHENFGKQIIPSDYLFTR